MDKPIDQAGHWYAGWPGAVTIRCPRCNVRAVFDAPFAVISQPGADGGKPVHQWGTYSVIEKHPNILPWQPPERDTGVPAALTGVVTCPACYFAGKHVLRWPEDAYYQWRLHGQTLWAWNGEHALALYEFIRSGSRDATRYPGYTESLWKLPKVFIVAKARRRVTRLIAERLVNDGLLAPPAPARRSTPPTN